MTLSIWTQNLLCKHLTALSSWPSLLPSDSPPLALDKAVSYIGQQRRSDRSLVPARLGKRGRPGNLVLPKTNASLDFFVVVNILLLLLLLLHIVLPTLLLGRRTTVYDFPKRHTYSSYLPNYI
jgi:hypothetical protein